MRDLENRLRKVFAHRRRWAEREGLSVFRVYDRDIPEHRYAIDWYAGQVHVLDFGRGRAARPSAEVAACVAAALGVAPAGVHVKARAPKVWGKEQYEKLAATGRRFVVEEQGLRFWVNLDDYADTGLFLDHRLTRARVRAEARGKRVLNLFCYTGAFTVYAAAGGAAATTSVDLSNTYLDWAEDNLALNRLGGPQHAIVRSDATRWLGQARGAQFELIVLDPPSFSASKKMEGTFDVQRDHPALLAGALALLAPGGALYFSTNFQGFVLDPGALAGARAEELTPASLPPDVRDRRVHRCWRLTAAPRAARGRPASRRRGAP